MLNFNWGIQYTFKAPVSHSWGLCTPDIWLRRTPCFNINFCDSHSELWWAGVLKNKRTNASGNDFIHHHIRCKSPQLTPFVSYLMACKASYGHLGSLLSPVLLVQHTPYTNKALTHVSCLSPGPIPCLSTGALCYFRTWTLTHPSGSLLSGFP